MASSTHVHLLPAPQQVLKDNYFETGRRIRPPRQRLRTISDLVNADLVGDLIILCNALATPLSTSLPFLAMATCTVHLLIRHSWPYILNFWQLGSSLSVLAVVRIISTSWWPTSERPLPVAQPAANRNSLLMTCMSTFLCRLSRAWLSNQLQYAAVVPTPTSL